MSEVTPAPEPGTAPDALSTGWVARLEDSLLALLIVLAVICAMLLMQSLLGPWYGELPATGRMSP